MRKLKSKKIKKVASGVLAALLLVSTIPFNFTQKIFGLDINGPNVLMSEAIKNNQQLHNLGINTEIINPSASDYTNNKYSFSLKNTAETRIEWDPGITNKHILYNIPESDGQGGVLDYIYRGILINSESLNGKAGCWLRNVGYYKGKPIDVRCTFSWVPIQYNGEYILPYIATGQESDKLGFCFRNRTYTVKYNLYSGGKPVNIDMSLTFGDVDDYQYFSFRCKDIKNIQIQNDCRIYYKYDSIKNEHWMYAGKWYSPDSLDVSVRYELENTNEFFITYGAPIDYSSKPFISASSPEESKDGMYKSYQDLKNNWFYNPNIQDNVMVPDHQGIGIGWGYFNSLAYLPYNLPSPVKNVSDANETNVTQNNVNIHETFTYTISQTIPAENEKYYYDSYRIKDTLPAGLTYRGIEIRDDNNKVVTNNFNVYQNGNQIEITAKNPKASSFYNNSYRFMIRVSISDYNQGSKQGNSYIFTNQAQSSITRPRGSLSANSNTVKTIYETVNMTVNKKWKDSENRYNTRPSFIEYNLKQDGNNYLTRQSLSQSGGWTTSHNNLPKYKPDGTAYKYTVEEQNIKLSNGDVYVPSYNGLTITNTITGKTSITITKIWQDWDNELNTRPNSLDIDILNNKDQVVKTVTLTAANATPNDKNKWIMTIDNLDKYDENGVLYTYHIRENQSAEMKLNYVAPVYDKSGLTVTNTAFFVPKDDIPEYMITIHKSIINNQNNLATTEDFTKIKLNANDTYNFPIVLRPHEILYLKNSNGRVYEDYGKLQDKTFRGIVTNKGDLVFDNIPAGKYLIEEMNTQHFDFVNFEKLSSSSNAILTKENGKYFITLPGLTAQNEEITVNVNNKIITDRSYDNNNVKNNLFKK